VFRPSVSDVRILGPTPVALGLAVAALVVVAGRASDELPGTSSSLSAPPVLDRAWPRESSAAY
jgi:hypothetical protein